MYTEGVGSEREKDVERKPGKRETERLQKETDAQGGDQGEGQTQTETRGERQND